jgi:diguanylate cyclase (GGDEF)-like protein
VAEIALVFVLVAALALAIAVAVRSGATADRRIRKLVGTLGGDPELAASLEPDEIVRRVLDAAAALPAVDAAVLDAGETRGALGASEEEIARAALQTPAHRNLRAMEVVYRYRLDEADRASSLLRAGLVVPLAAQGQVLGTITAFTRAGSHSFPPETVVALERLAARAGPALDNARRFVEARTLAEVDSLTGLRNRRSFHELLASEVDRARRYERHLSLIVFDLDDFKRINDRIGHLTGDAVLAEVAARVRNVVRSSDIACRVGGDEFGVIMPETALADAEQLANRIARTVAERPVGEVHTLFVSAGVAELRADDEPTRLFERADEALYRAKQAGKSRTIAAG